MSKPTPGPWTYYTGKLRPKFPTIIHEILGADGKPIVAWSGFDACDRPKREIAANAEFIVRACNSHEELLEAAKAIDSAIYAIREDLGTQFPALAEAWGRCRVAVYKAEGR